MADCYLEHCHCTLKLVNDKNAKSDWWEDCNDLWQSLSSQFQMTDSRTLISLHLYWVFHIVIRKVHPVFPDFFRKVFNTNILNTSNLFAGGFLQAAGDRESPTEDSRRAGSLWSCRRQSGHQGRGSHGQYGCISYSNFNIHVSPFLHYFDLNSKFTAPLNQFRTIKYIKCFLDHFGIRKKNLCPGKTNKHKMYLWCYIKKAL